MLERLREPPCIDAVKDCLSAGVRPCPVVDCLARLAIIDTETGVDITLHGVCANPNAGSGNGEQLRPFMENVVVEE
jgi:hypothetical protein